MTKLHAPPSDQEHARDVFLLLADRQDELHQFSRASMPDEDDDEGSPTPTLDCFFNSRGAAGIQAMINFPPHELNRLWDRLSAFVPTRWKVMRGKKSRFSAKDVFFMLLVVLKKGGMWDLNANIFRLKAPSFEKMVVGFLRVVGPKLYDDQVEAEAANLSMRRMAVSGRAFANFSAAMYATDATFQQGLAINCSDHVPGFVANIQLFHQNINFYQQQRVKNTNEDRNLQDDGPLHDEYPLEWAILADKGYQDLAHHMRVIHPKKADPGERLAFKDERLNRRISSDCIIVENFFGGSVVFGAFVAKSTSAERTCDGELYNQVQNSLLCIGDSIATKRRLTQEKYRARKRIRTELTINDLPGRN